MAAAAMLDFWNHEFLLANRVQKVEAHYCAIYRQNLSIGCKDNEIFQLFKMAATAILDFFFGFGTIWIVHLLTYIKTVQQKYWTVHRMRCNVFWDVIVNNWPVVRGLQPTMYSSESSVFIVDIFASSHPYFTWYCIESFVNMALQM